MGAPRSSTIPSSPTACNAATRMDVCYGLVKPRLLLPRGTSRHAVGAPWASVTQAGAGVKKESLVQRHGDIVFVSHFEVCFHQG